MASSQQPYIAGQNSSAVHTDCDKIIEIILIIFLPFVAVWFHHRECTWHVCFNICLSLIFWLPGILHAVWYCFIRHGGQ